VERTCIITGAGGRLGSRLCERLAGHYEVLGVYHRASPHCDSQIVRSIDVLESQGHNRFPNRPVHLVKADLCDPRDIERIVEVCLARFNKIDLLINAAADLRFYGSLLHASKFLAQAQKQIYLNSFAPILLAAAVGMNYWKDHPEDNRKANRNIVNVSSISGLNIYGGVGQGFYSASKAALNYLTCHLAIDYEALGVRANAICPSGFPDIVPTDLVVDEIIKLDQSDMSGKVILVDKDNVCLTN